MSLLTQPMKSLLAGLKRPFDDTSVKNSVDLLITEAKQAKNESSALRSRIWGTFVGLFLGHPLKWGEYASTKSCIAERVRHWVFIRADANHSENSPYGQAVRSYSKPLVPATVADIMKVSKAEYQKYELMSDVLGTAASVSGIAMTAFVVIKFLQYKNIQLPTDLDSLVKLFVIKR